ncbi:alpha-tocopherol transfer protein-like [Chironomus tepperi]|uniref:alpha-tocopherol transfer protein-like n=1 Tax=Chironomus tepperi TaxID=113505 RepID=UPI00391F0F1B
MNNDSIKEEKIENISHRPDQVKFEEFINRIKNEKSFPQTINKVLLERYLKISFNDVDCAFALLKSGLELRTKAPYLFTDRDVMSSEIQTACSTFQFVPLPKITKDKYKVTIIRFPKCDANLYDSVQVIKAALMMFDASYISYDNEKDGFVEGEIFILDVEGYSFKQFLDLAKNVKTLLFYTNFLQETAPVVLISNHICNTSSVFDSIMGMVKPILSKKVNELVHFNRYGTGILEHIEREVLPEDYGGDEKCINDLYEDWLKVFKSKRDYLLNDSNWKLVEDI